MLKALLYVVLGLILLMLSIKIILKFDEIKQINKKIIKTKEDIVKNGNETLDKIDSQLASIDKPLGWVNMYAKNVLSYLKK
jgi:hypothetical protein